MGDAADGLLDGTFDSFTGEYIGEGPGYPRTLETSNSAKVRGITKYIKGKTIKHPTEILKDFVTQSDKCDDYLSKDSYRNQALYISEACFTQFTQWLSKNK